MKQLLSIIILTICFSACNSVTPEKGIDSGEAIRVDESPGECPYLGKDEKGNVVLSWVKLINDSSRVFCYATSVNGKTFSTPVVIPNSGSIQPHGENLPKIIFKPSGEIIALWGAANPNPKNKYAGQVFYTQSFDAGRNWTVPKPLVSDTAGIDQRYYDVALLPGGEVGIIWLDNRKTSTKEGSALYFASTGGRNGFGAGKLVSEPCCQCCRTDLYVDQKGEIHALFRGIVQDSIRDMVHIVSNDGGKTFSTPRRISEDNWVINGCPHTGPAMTENTKGIHFAWFTGGKNRGCFYTRSADNGNSFIMHDSVSALGSHPQLASLPGGELLIVWDEAHMAGNKISKQIAVERRSAAGKSEGKLFITPADGDASYPVIAPLNERAFMVAYSNKMGGKSFVNYQVVGLK